MPALSRPVGAVASVASRPRMPQKRPLASMASVRPSVKRPEAVAGGEIDMAHRELGALDQTRGRAGEVGEPGRRPPVAEEDRQIVAGGGIGEPPRFQVKQPAEAGHEHGGGVLAGDLGICFQLDAVERRARAERHALPEGLGEQHELRGVGPLSRDVGDQEEEVAIVDQNVVVEVAADGPRGLDVAGEIDQPGPGEAGRREQGLLDARRGFQFALQIGAPSLFRGELDPRLQPLAVAVDQGCRDDAGRDRHQPDEGLDRVGEHA